MIIEWSGFIPQSIFWVATCFCGRWLLNNMEVIEDGNIGSAKDGEDVIFGNLGRYNS